MTHTSANAVCGGASGGWHSGQRVRLGSLPGLWRIAGLCLAAAVFTSVSAQTQGSEPGVLRVGVARADITPEGPVWMRGFAARKSLSEGVARPILAQCVLFANDETRLAIVALDICALSYGQLCRLREAAAAAGIPPQHLMINSSHNHFGPHLGSVDPHPKNLDYDALFSARTQPLFAAAAADLQPALVDYAVGTCTMAVNRRQLDEHGRCIGMRPEPRKPIDPDVPILRISTAAGQVRAVIFGYACHPTTAGGSMLYLIGTDYPGYARDWIAAAYPGAEAIFLQGCGGDIKPRAVVPGRAGASGRYGVVLLDERETKAAVGYELGRAVVAALSVPAAPVPAERPPQGEAALATPVSLGGMIELLPLPGKADPEKPAATPFHLGAWRIGDVVIVGSQGEVLSGIGLRLKREFAGRRLWTNGYTHWGGGYLPDAASYPEGGYEITSTAFAPTAEDRLANTAHRLIREVLLDPIHRGAIPPGATLPPHRNPR